MDAGRLGHERAAAVIAIGDLVVCIDTIRTTELGHPRKFIGLVLDKSITVYKIQVVDSGEDIYWPMTATYLWKETK